MKVLIADDEAKVCKLIRYLIDWEALGLSIVDVVHDGKAAFDSICEKRPDIVITDIRMPNYDGLELIRHSKEQNPDIYFIIISGYSHFEYAQQAIKFGVEDYLLKPLKKKELENTLLKIKEDYASRVSETEKREELKSMVDQSREQMKQNFLKELIAYPNSGGSAFGEKIDEINRRYNCEFSEGCFTVYRVRPYLKEKNRDLQSVEFVLMKIQQTLKERLEPLCFEFLSRIHGGEVVLLLNTDGEIHGEAEKLSKKMRVMFHNMFEMFREVNLVMAEGSCCEKITDVAKSYLEAGKAIVSRMGNGEKTLLTVEDLWNSQKRSKDFIDIHVRNDILACQERMDVEGLLEKISAVHREVLPVARDGRLVYDCFCELMETLLFGVKNYGEAFDATELGAYKLRFEESFSLEELFLWLERELTKEYENYSQLKKITESKPIREAKQYIYDNFNKNLSLESVSEMIGFNPAYFSTLFKKETGKNFSEYVTELRIQNAKTYLIQTDDEIAEIAFSVGYGDLKYFSKLFKKLTGLNPTEFRKLYG